MSDYFYSLYMILKAWYWNAPIGAESCQKVSKLPMLSNDIANEENQ